MKPISRDEHERLMELLGHPGFDVFIKLLEQSHQLILEDVLKYDLNSPNSERNLLLKRAKADGAGVLISALKRKIQNLKEKQEA
jgi:hypothetical protein